MGQVRGRGRLVRVEQVRLSGAVRQNWSGKIGWGRYSRIGLVRWWGRSGKVG